MQITSLYASILAILFVVLSIRALRMRRRLGIAVGDGGSPALLRAVRAHSNFAEYVPLGLLLIGFAELSGANAWLVHLLALCLLAGRAAHAYGISQLAENHAFRVAGMALTFTTLLGGSAYLLLSQAARAGL
jgi:uncharacterized protein